MALTNGGTHATTNGTTGEDHVASFWSRYEQLKLQGVMQNVLLEVSPHCWRSTAGWRRCGVCNGSRGDFINLSRVTIIIFAGSSRTDDTGRREASASCCASGYCSLLRCTKMLRRVQTRPRVMQD